MEAQERICTLCLENCDNFQLIEENMENVLNILLPKINCTTEESVICGNCTEMVIKCFDFKAKCLDTHDYLVPFVNNKDIVKLNLKDVYMSKNVLTVGVPNDHDVCGFCMGLVKNCSTVSLDVKEETFVLMKMMEQFLPELDFSVIEKPVICEPCHRSLENCFRFVTYCLIVGEKVQQYCESLDVNNKDPIDRLWQCITGDVKSYVDDNLADIVNIKKRFCEERENSEIDNGDDIIKLEQTTCEDITNVIGLIENKTESSTDNQKDERGFTPKYMLVCKEETNEFSLNMEEEIFCKEEETKHSENLVEIGDQRFLLNEEIQIKTDEPDFPRFEDGDIPSEVNGQLHGKWNSLMMIQDIKNTSTRHEDAPKRHVPIHKGPSDTPVLNCDTCSYRTKYKSNFNRHLRLHKKCSEVTMFKCNLCTYQSKYEDSIKQHLLVHKDPSEIRMFKCGSCSFQSKRNRELKAHMLVHKKPSEVTMFKCNRLHEDSGNTHLLSSNDSSETKFRCTYQTKYKGNIKKHLLLHETSSEVTMLTCTYCSFKTKWGNSLKKHLLSHEKPSEITMSKCDYCSFQTSRKSHLRNHLLLHKGPSEATIFKCNYCSYQANNNINLKRHLSCHKKPSKVTMFKCDHCSYQARRKGILETHLLLHRNPSEVTMFKCDFSNGTEFKCTYQTKYEFNLEKHLLLHKTTSEVTMLE